MAFRKEVLELDGYCCAQCGRTKDDGVLFHIHHKEYIQGKRPWEYPYEKCETLCSGCHAAEHGIIPPKEGWEYSGQDDLGDISGECELCNSSLRYLFYVFHPLWGMMGVGETCCDHLTSSEIASEIMRKKSRADRFIKSTRWDVWKNRHRISFGKIYVEIIKVQSGYKICMDGIEGKTIYENLQLAKLKAFEVIENGEAKKFLKKVPAT